MPVGNLREPFSSYKRADIIIVSKCPENLSSDEMDEIKLSIQQSVLEFIVDKAIELKLGARGLRSICEAILTEAMFNAPSIDVKELVIDLKYAQKQFSKSKISKLKVA